MEIINEIRNFVEEECKKTDAKYDYDLFVFHIEPVIKYAKELAKKRNADVEIVELSCLLHDVGAVINGRKDHHITSSEIAERKLKGLGYPSERIEKVKHCILSHRGSQNISRESIEAQILADADAMSHFDALPGLFRACYKYENIDSQGDAKEYVRKKLINSYNKLSKDSKEIIKPKFDAAMLLLE